MAQKNLNKRVRGLTAGQTLDGSHFVPPVDPVPIRLWKWLKKPSSVAILTLMSAAVSWREPGASAWCLFFSVGFTGFALTRPETAPFKLPIQSGILDSKQMNPANGKPMPAQGIFFIGTDTETGKEVWLTNSDCRQHFLIMGTTGSGKTELLLGFAANALSWGSGFLFCDGKGDVALFAKVFAMARRCGREDDVLVLNFMTGNADVGVGGGIKLSNTLNPFATGSSDGLTQLVVSLMDEVGGDGAMWKGRATAMLTGIMRALTWLRDAGFLDLNVGTIREFMSLKKIIELADEARHPDLPSHIRISVRSYLTSLPGYSEEKKEKQAQTTLDQHGYLEMQFTKILGNLADVYGHIFKTEYGEIDMYDVVLNRRLLIIMLPALEKAGDEIANLGRIVVATLKGMMGATLGNRLEGSWDDVVENRPTNSPSPFIVILDEVGYYTVEGMALMAAQARSLGFSMVYAAQDIPAMKKINEKEAASIIANTNTKMFGKTEEVDVTGKLAIDTAAKALTVRSGGFERQSGEFVGNHYTQQTTATFDERDRINFTDLQSQGEGEFHAMFQGQLVRLKALYADAPSALRKGKLNLRPNHFITVPIPTMDEIGSGEKIAAILECLLNADTPRMLQAEIDARIAAMNDENAHLDEISLAAHVQTTLLNQKKDPIIAACAAIAKVMTMVDAGTSEFNDDVRERTRRSFAGPTQGFDDYDDLGMNKRDTFAEPSYRASEFDYEQQEVSRRANVDQRRRTDDFEDQVDPFDAVGSDPFRVPDSRSSGRGATRADPIRPRTTQRKNPAVLDTSIRHGIDVDGRSINDMADNLGGNEAVATTLAALSFDPDAMTAEQVEDRIQAAATPTGFEPVSPSEARDSLARAAQPLSVVVPPRPKKTSKPVEEDTEVIDDFLNELLRGDDEDA